MIRFIFLLAFQHLRGARFQVFALLAMFAVSNVLALLTGIYFTSVQQLFDVTGGDFLVVQEFNQLGELGGSRLPPEVGQLLVAQRVDEIIPEIHAAVGVGLEEVIQMRGVNPADYRRTVTFEMLAGQALDEQTSPRRAMLGWRLAERLNAQTGSVIQLRGRDFQVVGIFRMRTYADNEAWVALSDSQALLGWGEDVSIYLIPANSGLLPGDCLGGQAEVVRRGEAVNALTGQISTLLAHLQQVSLVALVSCGLTLGVVLLRLAWMHRRELAVLHSLGYPAVIFGLYLSLQAAIIAASGSLLGMGGAWLAGSLVTLQAAGYAIPVVWEASLLSRNAVFLTVITLFGITLPAVWLHNMEPDRILRTE